MTPPAALVWLRDRVLAAGLAPTELRLSIPLMDGSWLNVSARNAILDPQLPPVIIGTCLPVRPSWGQMPLGAE